ncbi:DUF3800 domain-containing protein [Rhodopseudomonas julia]|nr:DUF3800 domain-containing protein [Rhodopseudomonas julia]
MYVFIDESGDPGFKLERGSTPIFVTSMVVFQNSSDAQETGLHIAALRSRLRIQPEFKFNKCSGSVRDAFFEGLSKQEFSVRAVVVQKHLIHSEALRTVKESFYKFFVRMMMQNDGGVLRDAKVVIDGSGDRLFKKQLRAYLRQHIETGSVRKWDLKDSTRDPLIQLADMSAGAIARSYRHDRKEASRWRDMLHDNGQLQNVWEFR